MKYSIVTDLKPGQEIETNGMRRVNKSKTAAGLRQSKER